MEERWEREMPEAPMSGWGHPDADPYGDVIRGHRSITSRNQRSHAVPGGCMPDWVPVENNPTPQERALPRPSTTPPMWAQQPQRSKRDRRSTRRVK